jgi:hypothetical protein
MLFVSLIIAHVDPDDETKRIHNKYGSLNSGPSRYHMVFSLLDQWWEFSSSLYFYYTLGSVEYAEFYTWIYFALVNLNLVLLVLPIPLAITRPVDFIRWGSIEALLTDLPTIVLNIHLGRVRPGRLYTLIVTFKELFSVMKALFINPVAFKAFSDFRPRYVQI